MKSSKKTISILLIFTILCGMLSTAYANVRTENPLDGVNLLAHYQFENDGKDSSGNQNDAMIGQGVTVEDGVASLPGGTKDSSAYITLPTGMFDNQDTVTISMWLKDEDPRANWLGAFFIGSAPNSNNVPENYYYFVPCERQHNTLKSVMTNSVNATSPNSTEVGLRESINTTAYVGVWTHYSIVLQPGSMNVYINGENVGSANVNRTISDYGADLEAYIGKSNYVSDPIYQGDFKDFRVYTDALNSEQIEQVMLQAMDAESVLELAAQQLTIPNLQGDMTNEDLDLPNKTFYDMVDVTWESSNANIMDSDGNIQDIDKEDYVELTATLSYNGLIKNKTFTVLVLPTGTYAYSMDIDGDNITAQLSDELYGLFFEDINSSADGGLYPEMVKNYSFENVYVRKGSDNAYFAVNGYETIPNYELHWTANPAANFAVDDANGLNEDNPHYAVLTGNISLQNGGFAPKSSPNAASMAVKPVDEAKRTGTYTFSVYANAPEGYGGTMKVKLEDANGTQITDEQVVPLAATGSWEKVSVDLTSNVTENTKGKMVLTIEDAGDTDELYVDMVSIVPHDTYGYGNKNYAYGVGIREDLVEAMMDLNPTFMRFPGGCIVEGFNWEGYYDWRFSVGSLEERKAISNRWENWGNSSHNWGYMQSFGFGYHEMLTLCEDYDIEAMPILNAGLLCQYETSGVAAKTGEDLQEFIDMATDLLDYCWGDPDSNEWAAKRKENGHAETFDLKYLGIGNENFGDKYFSNFDVLKDAVEAYAAEHYPDRELKIVSSAGPTSSGTNYEYAYDRIAQTMPGETLVDEHYYESESFMYNQVDRYDYYQRLDQGGSEVFVGEYATRNVNRYNTALAEAAFITGLERNADIVRNISYAPLFLKVGNSNWDHDLIYFDEFETAKSTNYYVQQMFGQNYGTELIGTELNAIGKDYSNYGSPILGTYSTAGYIDKVTIYDEDGNVLLEDDFEDNSNGWARFGSSSGSWNISDGRLTFTGTSGQNTIYLPQAVEEKWSNFRIEVEGAVKTSGSEGFLIGAGYAEQYYWYNLGWYANRGTYMEAIRGGSTKILGNNFANRHYNTGELTQIQNNDPMSITFNFGVDNKLEGSYTSTLLPESDTHKFAFSSRLNQYQKDIYQVVNKDDENVYVKLVNPDDSEKEIQLKFDNLNIASDTQAAITMLTGEKGRANAIGNEVIVPEYSSQGIENNQLVYTLPSYSVNVIRIPLQSEDGDIYEATFKNAEGNVISAMNSNEVSNDTVPEIPSRLKYQAGWAVEDTTDIVDFDSYVFTADTTFVPVYVEKTTSTVTVGNGTIKDTDGETSGEYEYFAAVTVVADEAEDDMFFQYWADENGKTISYKEEYTLLAPYNDITVTAVYGEGKANAPAYPVVYASFAGADNLEKKLTFTALMNDWEEYNVLQFGLLATSKEYVGTNPTIFKKDAAGVEFDKISTATHYTWTKANVTSDWYVRPYAIFKGQNGSNYIVYGEIARGFLNK